ncbi:hypothetical protein CLIM01_00214 [Colletotrichum limetticola]|uniref:Uncharacterized protein n=1 Tax=Colletotrichum limetticola TaxID=1209924 RepID=A0ABQ9QEZ2_9PEZI|nr:hypothetical protein CLIM01_00214 [Colletotrichum limetticola]
MEPPSPPQSREEADAQLQTIVHDRGIENGQANKFTEKQLRNALQVLAKNLYCTSTHFILELLQNADDNDYSKAIQRDSRPSFRLSIESCIDNSGEIVHYLETGCNENGFSLEQIDALCAIGESTKSLSKEVHSGYIGEKGIGFKSVFNVANVVYVSSGLYSFKLDKTRDMLGVLLPLPAVFIKPQRESENTSMALQLLGNSELERIAVELTKIKPEILLFLRRLRRIVVQTPNEQVDYLATYTDHDTDFHCETRTITMHTNNSETATETKYVIIRKAVEDMPEESTRKDIGVSEVTLAFPLEQDGSPKVQEQPIFAFLPVGHYGFQFLIQSDFILLADRERVPAENAWNNKIREAIPVAFEESVERFNKGGGKLRYSWPRYLVRSPSHDEFWDGLEESLIRHLQSRPVLQSRAGIEDLRKPQELVFVSSGYCLDGVPLIDSPKQRHRHLASEYSQEGNLPKGFMRLGVSTMVADVFVSHFCEWVSVEKPDLTTKSQKWHSKVAAILVRSESWKERLRRLPLVPTLDGDLLPARTADLYLAAKADIQGAPQGLGLFFVLPDARSDAKRDALFEWLGIKKITSNDICNRILQDHNKRNHGWDPRGTERLIEDAFYLFHNHRPHWLPKMNLWVATSNGNEVCRADAVYLIDPKIQHNLISKHSSEPKACMNVLHPDYFSRGEIAGEERAAQKGAFIEWLKNKHGVATSFKLLVRDQSSSEVVLSRESRWLLKNDSMGFIQLLRDEWLRNGLFFEYRDCLSILHPHVQAMTVPCRDGVQRKLQDTAVPTKALLLHCPHLAFADFPDPEDLIWQKFGAFSVTTKPSVEAYVMELEMMKGLAIDADTMKAASHIYLYLANNSKEISDAQRRAFEHAKTVYHPVHGWLTPNECTWKAPACLENIRPLAEFYPKCGTFFQEILQIPDAGIPDLIRELGRLGGLSADTSKAQSIKTVLLFLCKYLSSMKDPAKMPQCFEPRALPYFKVFPMLPTTHNSGGPDGATFLSLNDSWFIADRTALRTAFEGKVSLLDFDVKDIDKIMPLVAWRHLSPRLLSNAVEEHITYVSAPIAHPLWSENIQKKAKYIALLGTKATPTIPTFKVSLALGISVQRAIGEIVGESRKGHISITEEKDVIHVVVLRNPFKDTNRRVDMELADLFSRLFAIQDVERGLLISHILKGSFADVRDMLEGVNIRVLFDDDLDVSTGVYSSMTNSTEDPTLAYRELTSAVGMGDVARQSTPTMSYAQAYDRSFGDDDSDYDPQSYRFEEVGFAAEDFVNCYFSKEIPDWEPEKHWTSRLRKRCGYSDFLGDESVTADFTYTDKGGGYMLPLLHNVGIVEETWFRRTITYHMEVKGTVRGLEEPFHLSQKQMNLTQKYRLDKSKIPTDVFIIVRVYEIEGEKPSFRFYLDPWVKIFNGELVLRSDHGYCVAPSSVRWT